MHLDYVEFYITNVCNLNCERCNRFNNYAFTGHLHWENHAKDYEEWSKKISFDRIGILGGEPMLHPDFENWVNQIARLWPHSKIIIMTNGTCFDRYPNLFDWLCLWNGRVRIDVSGHNLEHRNQILTGIERVYDKGFVRYELHTEETYNSTGIHGYYLTHLDPLPKIIKPVPSEMHIWGDKSWQIVYHYDKIWMRYRDADNFDESVVRLTAGPNLCLANEVSDPDKAVSVCACKFSHHFMHGRLYKCGVVAVLPQFLEQFPVAITAEKMRLVRSYVPAHWEWSDNELRLFLQGLHQGTAVPQCGLCPEQFTSQRFAAGTKKLRIQKIKVHNDE